MRLVFYIFLIAQFLNFRGIFAEEVKKNSSTLNSIKWEKVPDNKGKPLKNIIWKSFKMMEVIL